MSVPFSNRLGKLLLGLVVTSPPSTPFNAPSYRVMQITAVRDL